MLGQIEDVAPCVHGLFNFATCLARAAMLHIFTDVALEKVDVGKYDNLVCCVVLHVYM